MRLKYCRSTMMNKTVLRTFDDSNHIPMVGDKVVFWDGNELDYEAIVGSRLFNHNEDTVYIFIHSIKKHKSYKDQYEDSYYG